MKKLFFIIFLLMHFGSAHSTEWFYANINKPLGKQIILTPTSIKGHRIADASTCPDTHQYICYENLVFNFAVPRSNQKTNAWTHKGFNYSVTKRLQFGILGVPIDGIEIEQTKDGKKTMNFLFSHKNGLIAFQAHGSTAPSFLLESRCGFGAPATCQEEPLFK